MTPQEIEELQRRVRRAEDERNVLELRYESVKADLDALQEAVSVTTGKLGHSGHNPEDLLDAVGQVERLLDGKDVDAGLGLQGRSSTASPTGMGLMTDSKKPTDYAEVPEVVVVFSVPEGADHFGDVVHRAVQHAFHEPQDEVYFEHERVRVRVKERDSCNAVEARWSKQLTYPFKWCRPGDGQVERARAVRGES